MTEIRRHDLGNGQILVTTWIRHPDRERWEAASCEIIPDQRTKDTKHIEVSRRRVDKMRRLSPTVCNLNCLKCVDKNEIQHQKGE